jgi:diguanylate cyclase (GGDEF)-like protein
MHAAPEEILNVAYPIAAIRWRRALSMINHMARSDQRGPGLAIRFASWRARDAYVGNDLDNANRLVGLAWVVYGGFAAALLSLDPPGGRYAEAAWAVAIAMTVLCTVFGLSTLRFRWAGFNVLLAVSYTMVTLLAILQALTAEGGAYQELYLPLFMIGAAAHPPRRVVPFVAYLITVAIGPLLIGDRIHGAISDYSVRMGLWAMCAALFMTVMAQLRKQRLAIRRDGEEAHILARTDVLTGLGNRRQLLEDLEALAPVLTAEQPQFLALFDLDGFKAYNDAYGHPAGDALLHRLGVKLAGGFDGRAQAYRMGGDEFCVLGPVDSGDLADMTRRAAAHLAEHGDGFSIRASHGSVLLPTETTDPAEALRLADRRMYSEKNLARTSAGRQTTDVLLKVLAERSPDLGTHMKDVTDLCRTVARQLALPAHELTPLLQAASLHDVGKSAIPDTILNKPGQLTEDEWAFMHSHTLVGERILGAAPSLAEAARVVRSSHEHFDGRGYPDGLAGDEIPLGARIIAICDAFDAMVSDRPYRKAMSSAAAIAEIVRCAGTQFDPAIVDAFYQSQLNVTAVAGPQPAVPALAGIVH